MYGVRPWGVGLFEASSDRLDSAAEPGGDFAADFVPVAHPEGQGEPPVGYGGTELECGGRRELPLDRSARECDFVRISLQLPQDSPEFVLPTVFPGGLHFGGQARDPVP